MPIATKDLQRLTYICLWDDRCFVLSAKFHGNKAKLYCNEDGKRYTVYGHEIKTAYIIDEWEEIEYTKHQKKLLEAENDQNE